MYESKDRMVSHPNHYISETGMEVIDVIEAFTSSRIWKKSFGTPSI